MDHRVNLYLRQVVEDLIENDIIDEQPQKYTTMPGRKIGISALLSFKNYYLQIQE